MLFNDIIKPALILAIIGFVSTMALSHINKITKAKIEARIEMGKEEALRRVLPEGLGYRIVEKGKKVMIDGKEFVYSIAEKQEGDKKVRAYAFETSKAGYSGQVRSVVSVDEAGKIIALTVIQQSETPGLGARSKEAASNETFLQHFRNRHNGVPVPPPSPPWFEQQFSGLDTARPIAISKKGEWRADNEALRQGLVAENAVSAITGATITTRAVRDSVEEGVRLLRKAIEMETPPPGEKKK